MAEYEKVCDICGERYVAYEGGTIYEQYRVDGIKDVCPSCLKAVREGYEKMDRIATKMRTDFVRRWILRLRRAAAPHSGGDER